MKERVIKRIPALILSVVIVLAMMPILPGITQMTYASEADATRLDVAKGSVTINSGSISGSDENGNKVTQADPDGYYLYSSSQTGNTVTINCSCTVYLGGLDILVQGPDGGNDYSKTNAFDIKKGCNVKIILVDGTKNYLASTSKYVGGGVLCGSGKAALHVPSGATLTIDGSGYLSAKGADGRSFSTRMHWGTGAAGIGGDGAYVTYISPSRGNYHYPEASGTIIINGGEIDAVGGNSCTRNHNNSRGGGGAGIGGGGGILGRSGGVSGAITINGGKVTVKAGKEKTSTPIGAGGSGRRTNGYVMPKAHTNTVSVNGGTLVLGTDMEIYRDDMLVIGKDGTLVVPNGVTLNINKNLTNNGTVTSSGTVNVATEAIVTNNGTFNGEYNGVLRYAITYELNGGTAVGDGLQKYYSNAEDTTLEEPTKEGYTFDGWYENAEFSGDPVAVIKKESKGNRKFYAKWSAEEYEITYVLNGGTNDKNNPESYTIESEDIKLKNPSRAGYAFMGWYIDEKMTEKAGDIAIPSGSTGERTFYAGWSSNCYTVTLDPNGGAGGIESVLAAFDWNMPSATMPNREGYTFAGYFDAKSGGTKYYNADGSSAKVWDAAEDKTLYAQWTANDYKVAFDANGGTGSMPDQDMTYDKAAGLTQNTFTRDGYTFEGWNTQADGKGTAYADKESVKNLAAEKGGKVTLYAQWKKYEPVQNLKAVPAGKTVEKLTWTKVKGAEGYDVYFAKCGRKLKKIKSTKALTLKKAGLKKGSSYRYKVKAYRKADGKKVYISSAYVSHAIAGGYNKKYTDAKSIRALKKSITLEAGKTSTVKAAQTKFRKGRRFLKNSHVQLFRYASTDKTVAAVDRHGKVTAKKAGTCRIYIYAQNGLADFTTITVK